MVLGAEPPLMNKCVVLAFLAVAWMWFPLLLRCAATLFGLAVISDDAFYHIMWANNTAAAAAVKIARMLITGKF